MSIKESKKVIAPQNIFLQHVVFQAWQAPRNPATNFFVRFCASELSQPTYLYSVKSKTVWHESAPICTNWHQLAPIGPNWAVSARSGTFWYVPGRSVPAGKMASSVRLVVKPLEAAATNRYNVRIEKNYEYIIFGERVSMEISVYEVVRAADEHSLSSRPGWATVRRAALLACVTLFAWNQAAFASNGAVTVSPAATPLRVVFFHSPTCEECHKVDQWLKPQSWSDSVTLERHDLSDVDQFSVLICYEEYYGVEVDAPPAVFVGRVALIGKDEIISRLGGAVRAELAAGTLTFDLESPSAEDPTADSGGPTSQSISQPSQHSNEQVTQDEAHPVVPENVLARFESFSVGAVAIAGLVDGINPCAFTTIVFLLSMLAYLGKSRQQLAVVGAGFTTAVFVTYFLLGLGLLGAIKVFAVSRGLSAALAYAVGGLALLLAAWSLVDFVRYLRSGDTQKVTLGLPKAVKARIHRVIRVGLSTRGLVIGSFTVGVVVALLESLCTGQVYLPTIMFVARAPGLRANAIGYLLLYNLLFIVPLVGILAIAYFGVRSEKLGEFFRRHLAAFKFAMAVVFAGLGVLVIMTA